MLYLAYLLLTCILIFYNLEVSFNFHFTFPQLNVIKMFLHSKNMVSPLVLAICFEPPITQTPNNLNFFYFPSTFKLSGV